MAVQKGDSDYLLGAYTNDVEMTDAFGMFFVY